MLITLLTISDQLLKYLNILQNSQRSGLTLIHLLETIRNVEIRHNIPLNITTHIDNRLLLIEAKQMLLQLNITSKAINSF